ncbi:MAG: thiamine pyrophosphate-dependent enzyme [Bacteroidota bacterium]
MSVSTKSSGGEISFEDFKRAVIEDFKLVNLSRQASLMGRKEVLTGKAKFGIFGDGKEVAQVAMAKVFRNGDFRSGYYRDQTFMMAIGELTPEQYFAGLYAHTDPKFEPMSAGRQMGGHYGTHFLNEDGTFKNLTQLKNSSSDISPTGSQMPRLLGLAYASYFFRGNKELQSEKFSHLSNNGNEVAFGTIGDASTSEGLFWETINAAGVLQIPMLVSVWDDGHGISVPKKYQTTKESISEILKGFQRENGGKGYEIYKTRGWDYPHLVETYEKAVKVCREEHVPVLIHVEEVTQPQGHSTSGSHERYKSKERLEWEKDFDPVKKMREWIIENAIATDAECNEIEEQAKEHIRLAKNYAWSSYLSPIKSELANASELIQKLAESSENSDELIQITNELAQIKEPIRKDIHSAIKKALRLTVGKNSEDKDRLINWLKTSKTQVYDFYSSFLSSQSPSAVKNISSVPVEYESENKLCDGREILRDNFNVILERYPEVLIFGEDSGKIGGVNQGLEGLQAKYGENRVFDTGIREATIMGQAIGLAMRGLRPICEIQYLDYIFYALQLMTDDLATIEYRTKGRQKAPVIIRTRGHRLEGIWHAGSPMGSIIHCCRGINICVPRNMTQASGFYNTLLKADEPALIVEPLNGYRLKEPMPSNFGDYCVPLGVTEKLTNGEQVTLVTYGSCVRVAQEAIKHLEKVGISVELIDLQTLLPFDVNNNCVESLKKTNRLVILDEDVPGGASGFILHKIIEEQGGFKFLDSAPITITSREHRPAYGSDGDYFSKPNADDVFERIYDMMHEFDPNRYPSIF